MAYRNIDLANLVFDESIYPRRNVDEMHIRSLMHAMDGSIELPPIVVEQKTERIVDGVHRYHAALRKGSKTIKGLYRTYENDAALFKDAVMLNTGVGLKLGTDDSLKVIDICDRLGLKELDQAAMLRTSIAHLRTIRPRYATVEDAMKDRRVPLKASVRHFSGEKISAAQEAAMQSAPGNSYLLLVNQLISAIENDLIPGWERHPTLWDRLEVLVALMATATKARRAAA
jgi:hypothetical protein